jgi:hypothetical protein
LLERRSTVAPPGGAAWEMVTIPVTDSPTATDDALSDKPLTGVDSLSGFWDTTNSLAVEYAIWVPVEDAATEFVRPIGK